jgi:DNA-binding GntR family transcriptional regulator
MRTAILDGTWPPGQPISPSQAIARFGGSRQTFADAVQRLEFDDLVVMRPHRTAIVAPIDAVRVGQAYAIWAAVTNHCALGAIPLLTDHDRSVLEQIAGALRSARTPTEIQSAASATQQVLVERYGQPVLLEVLRRTRALVDRIDLPRRYTDDMFEHRRAIALSTVDAAVRGDVAAIRQLAARSTRRAVESVAAVADPPSPADPPEETATETGVERLREAVFDWLVGLIVDGSLAVGETVPEREVASRLDVSTGTVRRAVRELAMLGLVDMQPSRPTVVRATSPERLFQGKHASLVLAEFGVSRSAARFTASDDHRLAASSAALLRSVSEDSADGGARYVDAIHDLLQAAIAPAGMPLLSRLLQREQWVQRRYPTATFAARDGIVSAVENVRAALTDRDGVRAAVAVAELRQAYDDRWAHERSAF